jgi:hypothetical protein
MIPVKLAGGNIYHYQRLIDTGATGDLCGKDIYNVYVFQQITRNIVEYSEEAADNYIIINKLIKVYIVNIPKEGGGRSWSGAGSIACVED